MRHLEVIPATLDSCIALINDIKDYFESGFSLPEYESALERALQLKDLFKRRNVPRKKSERRRLLSSISKYKELINYLRTHHDEVRKKISEANRNKTRLEGLREALEDRFRAEYNSLVVRIPGLKKEEEEKRTLIQKGAESIIATLAGLSSHPLEELIREAKEHREDIVRLNRTQRMLLDDYQEIKSRLDEVSRQLIYLDKTYRTGVQDIASTQARVGVVLSYLHGLDNTTSNLLKGFSESRTQLDEYQRKLKQADNHLSHNKAPYYHGHTRTSTSPILAIGHNLRTIWHGIIRHGIITRTALVREMARNYGEEFADYMLGKYGYSCISRIRRKNPTFYTKIIKEELSRSRRNLS